MLIFDAVLTLV